MMVRYLSFVLVIVIALSVPAFAAKKIPFPEWHRSEYDWSYPEDVDPYKAPVVIVRGNPLIHPSTHAFIHAPRAINALINHEYQSGKITRDEWRKLLSDFRHAWIRWFTLQITLFSDDYEWASTGGPFTGPMIPVLTIETSNGHKYVRDDIDFLLPTEVNREARYVTLVPLSYPREVIDSRPEWIRLTVTGEDYEYYFHWDFEV